MTNDAEGVLKLDCLFQISQWQHRLQWKPFREGVDIYRLYGGEVDAPRAALLRFHPGGHVPLHEHIGYEHILILDGSQVDENSKAESGTLLINPPGTRHSVLSEAGCIVLAIYERPVKFVGDAPIPNASQRSRALVAVNGTLMRGLELNPNLLDVNATFVRETTTGPSYRLWSINDRHPAMVRVSEKGSAVSVEVWSIPAAGLASILLKEPSGLSIGKITLADGSEILGVLAEPFLCEGQKEITSFGGWREYISSLKGASP